MPGKTSRSVGTNGRSQARYVVLPRAWCEASGVDKGSRVEVLYDGVLIVLPPDRRSSAPEILRLMREGLL